MAYTNEPVKKVEEPVHKGPGTPREQDVKPTHEPPWTTLEN